jgi:hypothetical protein
MLANEWNIGSGQTMVIYVSDDTGGELVAPDVFAEVGRDATARAQRGLRIVSMVSIPLRHAGAVLGREGSGYETKVAIAVVYG